jgi:autotransporter passenger strand-loop-strand repeat protein
VADFGGTETLSGGTAISAVLLDGGLQFVSSGGTASATIVSSGATEVISSGGTSINTQVLSGGTEIVLSGGSAINTTVFSGGTEIDPPAGPALAAPSYLGQATVLGGGVSFTSADRFAAGSGDTTVLGGAGTVFHTGGAPFPGNPAGFDTLLGGSLDASALLEFQTLSANGAGPQQLLGHDPISASMLGGAAAHTLPKPEAGAAPLLLTGVNFKT